MLDLLELPRPKTIANGCSTRLAVYDYDGELLSLALTSDVTIPLTLTPGSAEARDYGALESITVSAGATTGTGMVTTARTTRRSRWGLGAIHNRPAYWSDDGEDGGTSTVALGSLPMSVKAGSPSSVESTIADATAHGGSAVDCATRTQRTDRVGLHREVRDADVRRPRVEQDRRGRGADDAHDDGGEAFTLAPSNASGAWLEDAEATRTIENTDLMPTTRMARIGGSRQPRRESRSATAFFRGAFPGKSKLREAPSEQAAVPPPVRLGSMQARRRAGVHDGEANPRDAIAREHCTPPAFINIGHGEEDTVACLALEASGATGNAFRPHPASLASRSAFPRARDGWGDETFRAWCRAGRDQMLTRLAESLTAAAGAIDSDEFGRPAVGLRSPLLVDQGVGQRLPVEGRTQGLEGSARVQVVVMEAGNALASALTRGVMVQDVTPVPPKMTATLLVRHNVRRHEAAAAETDRRCTWISSFAKSIRSPIGRSWTPC